MPTIQLDAWGHRSGDIVELRVALPDGTLLQRQVTWSKVDTPLKLAQWLLDQAAETRAEVFRQQFTVTFHLDANGGLVVDDVAAAELPEETAWNALAGSALGSVTVAEAEAVINAAASLSDVQAILRHIVRLLIPLRNIVQHLLAGLRRSGLR